MATDFIDKLTFLSHPSGKGQGKHHIVIVGAGIIGVCTAYYLTRHADFDPSTHHITILESKRVAGGASGKAGGLLASWAFPQQIVPLSFQLHQDLSDEHDGENNWDYRRLTTVSLEADVQNVGPNDDGEDSDSSYSSYSSSCSGSSTSTGSDSSATGNRLSLKKKLKAKLASKNKSKTSSSELEIGSEDPSPKGSSRFHSSSNIVSSNIPQNAEESDKSEESKKKGGASNNSTSNNDNNNSNNSNNSSNNNDDDDDIPLTNLNSDENSGFDMKQSADYSENKSTSATNSNLNSNSIPLGDPSNPLPSDLNWIKKNLVKDWSSLGGTDSTAQVHPYKFTHFLLLKAMETEAVDLILGKVTKLQYNESGACCGISYNSTTDDDSVSNDIVDILDAQQVVLTMGPWTSKLLPDCPISGLRAHSITLKPSTGTVSPYAIFTELKIGKNEYFSPEMYARKDEVYVCGEGDTLVELPETTDAVEVVREKCDELYHYVSKLSKNLSNGHILKRQACYLPVLNVPTSSGPLIGETNVDNLYIASGHSCWGINNAPGTGKVMAELLLERETKSADISALDPSLYFDASILE
ncbi:hypothetical protein HG535_0D05580 [Zygotorulaspora mrakii]|uniref:FAD dependent oxidoreductase domain-containing protein n=1 Tax=Zygotorulaspora mrakii TaxID=42260 RepID=A0A7H9B4F1_ZYGMR|nr:uncharacterized protein HG535_0D05580 [Zygotorulaspora mrakii]QLG72849.1 hypothetical protein HG535_0D05580 [Zygotorulaspora mrakii]